MRMYKVIAAALLISGLTTVAFAGDDPSIKAKVRTDIQAAMEDHIKHNTIGDHYMIYDAVDGKMRKLTFEKLHKGIVKKSDFYVSCADFVDAGGEKVDIDFFVVDKDGSYSVLQGLVHKVDGTKRPYHLED